jgi:hypothetical protein
VRAPFAPLRLTRVPEPFDHRAYLFELKYDGFRALAFVEHGRARLISRNGNTFRRFAPLAASLVPALRARHAVIDGEIVCLDADGRADFDALFYRRRPPVFVAFDLLALNGKDLRARARSASASGGSARSSSGGPPPRCSTGSTCVGAGPGFTAPRARTTSRGSSRSGHARRTARRRQDGSR